MSHRHQTISDELAAEAAVELAVRDPELAGVIERFGRCPIRPHSDYYQALVRSIIGQQLSVKAAASINLRITDHFGGQLPSPAQVADSDIETLRGLGLSRAKALYVQDLAGRVLDGSLEFSNFDTYSNDHIISELTAVKGIGEWTAHVFLMFCMARSDVLPYGDLGIRNGVQKLYGLEALPDRAAIEVIASTNRWHPYETIASWYIWQSLDNAPTAAS